MNLATLFLLPKGVRLLQITLLPNAVVLEATTAACGARPCPHCQTPSAQVHSSYTRTIADVPCVGRHVILRLQVRKFRCRHAPCPQRIFVERFPAAIRPWARKTTRLQDLLQVGGLLAGGRGAQTLARLLGIRVSDRTILRLLRTLPEPHTSPVRVLGVDDFAFRRGRTFGTVLVDLERKHVIDLLPDRSQMGFTLWLQRHPEVHIISRDRGGDYAAAATFAAPDAVQVADRFHLLTNAGEAFERCLTRHHAHLREAARALAGNDAPVRTTKRTPAEQRRQRERRGSRQERYEQVVALFQHGASARQIAHDLSMARGTVLTYVRAHAFPERASRPRSRLIDPYVPYLQERWNAGEHSARVLWRAMCGQGFRASDMHVRRLVNGWRTPSPTPGAPGSPLCAKPEVIYYSVHKTRWLLMKPAGDLSASEAAYVALLTYLRPHIADAQHLVTAFHTIVSDRAPDQLHPWLEQCEQCGIAELVGFAQGIRRDYAAVQAAVSTPWSQGPVEGQVNRLKMLKRQMYGRAGFALLRRRVLQQQTCAPQATTPRAPKVWKNPKTGQPHTLKKQRAKNQKATQRMGTQRAEPGQPARRPRRRHSSAFKARVALEALKGQKTLNEQASEFGVHSVQIAQWKRQLRDASAGVFENGATGRHEREQQEQVEQLYQEIGQLKVEVDWLRKKGISRLSNSANNGR